MATVSMRLIAVFYGVVVNDTAVDLLDIGFTADQINQADNLLIQVLDAAIREKHDGDAPTTTEGWLHTTAGDGFAPFAGKDILREVQIVRDGSGDATINIALYRGL